MTQKSPSILLTILLTISSTAFGAEYTKADAEELIRKTVMLYEAEPIFQFFITTKIMEWQKEYCKIIIPADSEKIENSFNSSAFGKVKIRININNNEYDYRFVNKMINNRMRAGMNATKSEEVLKGCSEFEKIVRIQEAIIPKTSINEILSMGGVNE
jgi:hypothetical protein